VFFQNPCFFIVNIAIDLDEWQFLKNEKTFDEGYAPFFKGMFFYWVYFFI